MITGAHIIIYSTDAEADRALLKDALELDNIDVGGGCLLFKLPPAEAAVHPSDENDKHELYLMCDDVERAVRRLNGLGIPCEPLSTQGWGLMTRIRLPGGGSLGLYEPRHARP
ncbi:MAG: hypothetical protein JWN66_138 [Sphingomonas bacterium]|uniref:VOC family protein n=1 Tax=Sphingomonas bacterium TaxID=1895847 RepID=UPI002607B6BF|nr:hypothetical protein [Sphingomonas bacterium]MDB5703022.1 hypothetical protein [Sphingomonas bacterium]